MKAIAIFVALAFPAMNAFAQSKSFFLKQDTLTFTSRNSNWLVPPAGNANAKTLGAYFIESIRKGKLKATDPVTGKAIPAKEILTWNTQRDSVVLYDLEANVSGYQVYQQEINPDDITRIRMIQSWYLDIATNQLFSKREYVLLYVQKMLPSGTTVVVPFCKINY